MVWFVNSRGDNELWEAACDLAPGIGSDNRGRCSRKTEQWRYDRTAKKENKETSRGCDPKAGGI